jgi:hypothetical protein
VHRAKTRKLALRKAAIVLLLLPVLAFGGCNLAERVYALKALPSGTGAWFVTYADNRTYGFGPGGNETGFNVVLLSESGARRVAEGGVAWLNGLSGGRIQPDWAETPVPRNETWMGRKNSAAGAYPDPTVLAVLNRYGFGFDLAARHQTALDAALNAPGSFYAGGRGVMVVIVPKTLRAYVFYAG